MAFRTSLYRVDSSYEYKRFNFYIELRKSLTADEDPFNSFKDFQDHDQHDRELSAAV